MDPEYRRELSALRSAVRTAADASAAHNEDIRQLKLDVAELRTQGEARAAAIEGLRTEQRETLAELRATREDIRQFRAEVLDGRQSQRARDAEQTQKIQAVEAETLKLSTKQKVLVGLGLLGGGAGGGGLVELIRGWLGK